MSATTQKSGFKQLSLRTLVFAFFVLSFLVLTDIFVTSSSRSSFIIDVSMRVKTDISKAFRNLMNLDRVQALNGTINGTLIIQPAGTENMSEGKIKILLDNKVTVKRLNATLDATDNVHGNVNKITGTTMQYNVLGNPMTKGATDNKRKDECNNCFKHNFKYLINNPDICKLNSGQRDIELVIIILTVHRNIIQRNTLRETWLTHSKNNSANVRYAFLLGEIKDAKLQEDVRKESKQFEDIIKEDFVDAYSNLTYKTIMGFKWAATRCDVAKAVLKTDDDMYINVPNVLDIIRNNYSSLQANVVGSCAQKAGPIRNEKSKWFASVNSYPGKFYPGFCSGTGYLTSLNVARKVYEISPHVPFFHLEDVYVALCIKKLGYHLRGFPGFNPGHPKLDACLYNGKSLVTAHYMTPAMTRQMWKAKCVPNTSKSKSWFVVPSCMAACIMCNVSIM